MDETLSNDKITGVSYVDTHSFFGNTIPFRYLLDQSREPINADGNSDSYDPEDFIKNGINHLLEIYHRDHLRIFNGNKLFSKREKEVLIWMAEGLSSKMIAHKLNISEHTVINHRRSMQEKSNKPNATALVSFAIRNGII